MSVWCGRTDRAEGPLAIRWHERVVALPERAPPGFAIVGFACDEGVRRNQGRVGAANGPRAIRQALANLAWHQQGPVYDAGDVTCEGTNLEAAQEQLATIVTGLLTSGHRPLVLGGGHETAWGTFLGLARAQPDANIGVINLDAHFDLRAAESPNSGTPFTQISDWCRADGRPFRYLCLGIAESANTKLLFERAASLGVKWRLDVELAPWQLADTLAQLESFLKSCDASYLSLDLDVLPASIMPAVSAPASRGVALETIETLIEAIVKSGKLAAADVVEFNPIFDSDGRSAKVAAGLVWKLARCWSDFPPVNAR
jgi:formiminoglutamase